MIEAEEAKLRRVPTTSMFGRSSIWSRRSHLGSGLDSWKEFWIRELVEEGTAKVQA